MKEVLDLIITAIVANPAIEYTISQTETEEGVTFEIEIPEEFKGKLIGKEGRTIKAIRDVLSIIAKREDRRVQIKVLD